MSSSSKNAKALVERDDAPVRVGDLVGGKYLVDGVLGEGGMGYLVRAEHQELNDFVALKFLRRESLERPDVVARFKDEARAAVRLRSEHVARVMDVGEHEGVPYIVMEYLKGRDLRDILTGEPLMPIARAVEFIVEACEGLAEAHANGIVHRDVKPENLFISQRAGGREVLKVLDFGISKIALEGKVTEISLQGGTQDVVGSPLYMAPEQIRTPQLIDRRIDVWSLGIVLFELLTGQHPFGETTEFTVLVANVLEKKPLSVRTLRPEVPEGLDEVIQRALAKSHAQRFPTTADLALALLPFARTRARRVAMQAAQLMSDCGWLEAREDILSSLPPGSERQKALQAELERVGVVAPRLQRTPYGASPLLAETSRITSHAGKRSKSRTWLLVGAGIAVIFAIGIIGFFERSNSWPKVGRPATVVEERRGPTVLPSNSVHSTRTEDGPGAISRMLSTATVLSASAASKPVGVPSASSSKNPVPATLGSAPTRSDPELDIRPER